MFYLQIDDGTIYGGFDTLEEALRCDIESMAIFSLDQYQTRAKQLHSLGQWLGQWTPSTLEEAKALVLEVDHVVIEVKWAAVTVHEPEDAFFCIAGEVANPPEKLIEWARGWATSGAASEIQAATARAVKAN